MSRKLEQALNVMRMGPWLLVVVVMLGIAAAPVHAQPGPIVTLIEPVGGESYQLNADTLIRCTHGGPPANFDSILLSTNGGTSFTFLKREAAESSHTWNTGGTVTTTAQIRVIPIGMGGPGMAATSGNFAIGSSGAVPTVTLVEPVGGETYSLNTDTLIRCTHGGGTANFDSILFSTGGGGPGGGFTFLKKEAAASTHTWNTGGMATTTARIRIIPIGPDGYGAAATSGNFTIGGGGQAPTVTLVEPVGGETYSLNTDTLIRCTHGGGTATLDSILFSTGGPMFSFLKKEAAASTHTWNTGGTATNTARIRIIPIGPGGVGMAATSGNFTIGGGGQAPTVTLSEPLGGEQYPLNADTLIRCTHGGGAATTDSILFSTGGPMFTFLKNEAAASSHTWNTGGTATTTARIRIIPIGPGGVGMAATSGNFTIGGGGPLPTVTLVEPVGGETYSLNTDTLIRCTHGGGTATTDSILFSTGGPMFTFLKKEAAASTHTWNTGGTATTTARIRIIPIGPGGVGMAATSGNFTIGGGGQTPTVTLIEPVGGETYSLNTDTLIRCTHGGGTATTDSILFSTGGPMFTFLKKEAAASTHTWNTGGTATTTARIRIIPIGPGGRGTAATSGMFTIGGGGQTPTVTLIEPVGGETYSLNTDTLIRCTHGGGTATTDSILFSTGGPMFTFLKKEAAASTHTWNTGGTATNFARIRIIPIGPGGTGAAATSGRFTIGGGGTPPTVTLIEPVGGEAYALNADTLIRCTHGGGTATIDSILFRTTPFGPYTFLKKETAASFHTWNTGGTATNTARIRIISLGPSGRGPAATSANFTIGMPRVTLIEPVGGEAYALNADTLIRCTHGSASPTIYDSILFSIGGGGPGGGFTFLKKETAADFHTWNTGGTATNTARIRIIPLGPNGRGAAATSANFTIGMPSVILIEPVGGEQYQLNADTLIRCIHDGGTTTTYDSILLSTGGGGPGGGFRFLKKETAADFHTWNTGGIATNTARIRIYPIGPNGRGLAATSGNFTIGLPSVTLIEPVGGEQYQLNADTLIRCTHGPDPVTLDSILFSTGGPFFTFLKKETAASYHTWNTGGTATTTARIRIVPIGPAGRGAAATSRNFTIGLPRVALVEPVGGEQYQLNTDTLIRCTHGSNPITVTDSILFSTGGPFFTFLKKETAASYHTWNTGGTATTTARIRIIPIGVRNAGGAATSGNFTISNSVLPPTVTLIEPVGGERYLLNTDTLIRCSHNGTATTDSILLSTNGTTFRFLKKEAAAGSHTWNTGGTATNTARIRIIPIGPGGTGTAATSRNFTIAGAASLTVTLIEPVGGEVYAVNKDTLIRCSHTGVASQDSILFSTDGGASFAFLKKEAAAGSHAWNTGGTATNTAQIRIFAIGPSGTSAPSTSGNFTILAAPTVTLIEPVGGEEYPLNADTAIRCSHTGVATQDSIAFSTDGGTTFTFLKKEAAADYHTWNTGGTVTTTAQIEIFAIGPGGLSAPGTSGNFSIVAAPTVILIEPVGGEEYPLNADTAIRCSHTGVATQDSILFSTDGGTTFTFLKKEAAADYHTWNTGGTVTTTAQIEIFAIGPGGLSAPGTSGNFSIVAVPTVTLIEPVGGEQYPLNTDTVIRCTHTWLATRGITPQVDGRVQTPGTRSFTGVKSDAAVMRARGRAPSLSPLFSAYDSILFSTDGGTTFTFLKKETAADFHTWNTGGTATTTAQIQIFAVGAGGTSNPSTSGNFSILVAPAVTLIEPVGGEEYPLNADTAIRCSHTGVATQDSILFSTDGGTTFTFLKKEAAADYHTWNTGGTVTTTAQIEIFAIGPGGIGAPGTSGNFSIVAAPTVTLIEPVGGEEYPLSTDTVIRCTHTWLATRGTTKRVNGRVQTLGAGSFTRVRSDAAVMRIRGRAPSLSPLFSAYDSILFSTDGGTTFTFLKKETAADFHTWNTGGTATTTAQIQIFAVGAGGISNPSTSGDFSILAAPTVTLVEPVGGEEYPLNADTAIRCSHTGVATQDSILFSTDGGTTFTFLKKETAADYHTWNTGGTVTSTARIEIFAVGPGGLGAPSTSGDFSILGLPTVTLIEPVGGEQYGLNTDTIMRISHTGVVTVDSILLSTDSGATFTFLEKETAADFHTWNTGGTATGGARIKIFVIGPGGVDSTVTGSNFSIGMGGISESSIHELINSLSVGPNPASRAATVRYSLRKSGNVRLELFDISGKLARMLVDGYRNPGVWDMQLSASNLARGIYVLKLATTDYSATRKLIIE